MAFFLATASPRADDLRKARRAWPLRAGSLNPSPGAEHPSQAFWRWPPAAKARRRPPTRGSWKRPKRSWRRPTAPLLAAAIALGAVGVATAGGLALAEATATPAGADPIGDCSTTSGVIVVVDFSHWGQSAQRGCAADPVTGYDALQQAGFTTAGDERDGPAFICRIDDEPPPTEDPCINTPPPSAYWSYWNADQGQTTWSYSDQGAMSYEPPAGSVEAWTFGAGTPPSFSPGVVLATNVSPASPATTTTAAPSTGLSPAPSAPSSPGSGPANEAGPSASSGSGPSTRTPTTPPDSTTAPTPTSAAISQGGQGISSGSGSGNGKSTSSSSSSPVPRIVDAAPAHTKQAAAGSPLPVILGAVLAFLLAGCATVVAWWRRRASKAGEW